MNPVTVSRRRDFAHQQRERLGLTPGWCHKGLRAKRYARNVADMEAHPEIFRCPHCGWILDGPK